MLTVSYRVDAAMVLVVIVHVVNACFVVKESPCCYNEKVSGDMILEFGSLHVRATGS